MDKCPFWSTNKKIVPCNEECPMNICINQEECIFKEVLSDDKGDLIDFSEEKTKRVNIS